VADRRDAEERAALARYGDTYRDSMSRVPPFLPRWRPAAGRGSPETPARQ
jgi:hypothetical protein